MIPNCKGCQEELSIAYEEQEKGNLIVLDGMGIREHCFVTMLDKDGKIIIF